MKYLKYLILIACIAISFCGHCLLHANESEKLNNEAQFVDDRILSGDERANAILDMIEAKQPDSAFIIKKALGEEGHKEYLADLDSLVSDIISDIRSGAGSRKDLDAFFDLAKSLIVPEILSSVNEEMPFISGKVAERITSSVSALIIDDVRSEIEKRLDEEFEAEDDEAEDEDEDEDEEDEADII